MSYEILSAVGDYHEVIFAFAMVILVGAIFGKLISIIKVPEISGYIIAGLIIGPYGLSFIDIDMFTSLGFVTEIVLGFIAFNIGAELFLPTVKKSGKDVVIITIVQAIITFVVVYVSLIVLDQPLWLTLILASVAVATAPAPIFMIIKTYGAKGPLTKTLLPLVGIDDAVGILIFSVCLSFAASSASGAELQILDSLLHGFKEIGLSLLVGGVLGLILAEVTQLNIKYSTFGKYENQLDFSVIVILISVYLAYKLHLSIILTPMALGFIFTNLVDKDIYQMEETIINSFLPPTLVVFFVLAGMSINIGLISENVFIGVIYIAARFIGKIGGAFVGAHIAKSDPVVRNNIGFTLLPQGGVEIGLILAAKEVLNVEQGEMVQTIAFSALLFFELVGPILCKFAMQRAGELGVKN